jgi:hypothetical protein
LSSTAYGLLMMSMPPTANRKASVFKGNAYFQISLNC